MNKILFQFRCKNLTGGFYPRGILSAGDFIRGGFYPPNNFFAGDFIRGGFYPPGGFIRGGFFPRPQRCLLSNTLNPTPLFYTAVLQ